LAARRQNRAVRYRHTQHRKQQTMTFFDYLIVSFRREWLFPVYLITLFEEIMLDGGLQTFQHIETFKDLQSSLDAPTVMRPLLLAMVSWLHYSNTAVRVRYLRCLETLVTEEETKYGRRHDAKIYDFEHMFSNIVHVDPAHTSLWLQRNAEHCRFAFVGKEVALWSAHTHLRKLAALVFALHRDTWPAEKAAAHGPCMCAKHAGMSLAEQEAAIESEIVRADAQIQAIRGRTSAAAVEEAIGAPVYATDPTPTLYKGASSRVPDEPRDIVLPPPPPAPSRENRVRQKPAAKNSSLLKRALRAVDSFLCPLPAPRKEARRAAPHPPRYDPNDGVPPVYRNKTSKQVREQHVVVAEQ
jgi:hypothetical protein